MKALLAGCSIALVLLLPACKKPEGGVAAAPQGGAGESVEKGARVPGAGETADEKAVQTKAKDRSERGDFSLKLNEAQNLFATRDIKRTLEALDEIPEEFRTEAGFLNLRGACYTEMRDFKAALADFKEASKKNPGNPSIRFNVAEMSFVTHDWEQASKEFQVLQSQGAVHGAVSDLVDFKLMLCEEGRGNTAEFDRRAAENMANENSLLAAYTKAAMEFRTENAEEAKATLADAETRFPKAGERAPWHDTMIEFGYDPRK